MAVMTGELNARVSDAFKLCTWPAAYNSDIEIETSLFESAWLQRRQSLVNKGIIGQFIVDDATQHICNSYETDPLPILSPIEGTVYLSCKTWRTDQKTWCINIKMSSDK